MTNPLSSTTALQNAVASRSPPPGNLTRSVDSSKRLDHFAAKLFVCHPVIYLLVKREAFQPANILREPTESG